jgi:hypothetical protein
VKNQFKSLLQSRNDKQVDLNSELSEINDCIGEPEFAGLMQRC